MDILIFSVATIFFIVIIATATVSLLPSPRWKQKEKREMNKNNGKPEVSAPSKTKAYFVVLVIIISVIFYKDSEIRKWIEDFWLTVPEQTAEAIPLCADQKVYTLMFNQPEVKVQLQPACWSGWVKLPNQANFRITNPGRLQMLTWDGRYLEFGEDDAKWLGQIPFVNFRLKGEGEAKVFVEKKA